MFTISSQRREQSPTRTFKWPGPHHVQITCDTSSTYHVQPAVCHFVRRDSSGIKFDRVELAFILALFYFLKPLTDDDMIIIIIIIINKSNDDRDIIAIITMMMMMAVVITAIIMMTNVMITTTTTTATTDFLMLKVLVSPRLKSGSLGGRTRYPSVE